MKCCDSCKDINGDPVELTAIYVKKHKTRMNSGGLSMVGGLCPVCFKPYLWRLKA